PCRAVDDFVEGAFVARTIAEEADLYVVCFTPFARTPDARGEWYIAPDDGVGGNHPNADVASVHRSALAMTAAVTLCKHLARHGIERDSLRKIMARGPMRRRHVVGRARVIQHSNGTRFLAVGLVDTARDSTFEKKKVNPFFI